MEIEDVLRQVPKPILVPLVIVAAIGFIVLLNPMHTVCDTQIETLNSRFVGLLTPISQGKVTMPPAIQKARANCKFGNTAGACMDYTTALKRVAKSVKELKTECYPLISEVETVNKVIVSGLVDLVTLAWGSYTPEPGAERLGWMHETELATYCYLKDAYNLIYGQEGWKAFRSSVAASLPGEAPKVGADGKYSEAPPEKAVRLLGEQEVLMRSLFSVNCEQFR